MTVGKLTSESGVPASTIRYRQRVDVLQNQRRALADNTATRPMPSNISLFCA